jgi:flagellar biosynthesis anti-sigma factor FlgM
MTMKINGGELRSAGVTTTVGNARVKDSGKTVDTAAPGEAVRAGADQDVKITVAARQLLDLVAPESKATFVDEAKVARLRAEIENGTYRLQITGDLSKKPS